MKDFEIDQEYEVIERMIDCNDIMDNYGIIPPENSKPIWGRDNLTEDEIVTSIDLWRRCKIIF